MFWAGVVGSITTVLVVVAVRDVLLASSLICTTSDIINNHISSLVSFIRFVTVLHVPTLENHHSFILN